MISSLLTGCSIARVDAPPEWANDERADWQLIVNGRPDSTLLSVSLVNGTKDVVSAYQVSEFMTLDIECVSPVERGGHAVDEVQFPLTPIQPGGNSFSTFNVYPKDGWKRVEVDSTDDGDYACRMIYDESYASPFDAPDDWKPNVGPVYSRPFFIKVRGYRVVGFLQEPEGKEDE
jgi:hypothetical protein